MIYDRIDGCLTLTSLPDVTLSDISLPSSLSSCSMRLPILDPTSDAVPLTREATEREREMGEGGGGGGEEGNTREA